jgi:hypothetical protein
MPPQEFVDPVICQDFVAPILNFIEDFTFGRKVGIVGSRQNHFNHFSFLIIGEPVGLDDRLTGMFFSFSSNSSNTPDMSFGNLINRGELLIIHCDITFIPGIFL